MASRHFPFRLATACRGLGACLAALACCAWAALPAQGAELMLHEGEWGVTARPAQQGLMPEVYSAVALVLLSLCLVLAWVLWRHRGRQLYRERLGRREESQQRKEAEHALQSSQELLSEIIKVNTDGMVVLDDNGTVLFANPAAASLLEKNIEEIAGRLLGIFSSVGTCQLELPRPERKPRIVEASCVSMEWAGQDAKLLCLRDITKRAAAEAQLAESQSMLNSTFHSMQDLVLVIDRSHRIRLSNWRGLEDLSEEERAAEPCCHKVLYDRESPCPGCELPQVFSRGESRITERTFEARGRIYEESMSPMFDENGRVDKVVKHLRDITEHRLMEQEVQKNERLYRLLAENMPDGAVHLFDKELKYVISEGAILETLGLRSEDLMGKTVHDVVPPETAELLEPCYHAALRGEKCMVEIELEGRIFEVRTLPLEGAQGDVTAGMVLSQDITQRKKAERKLRASEERFRAVFENAAMGVSTLDLEGRFLSTNSVYSTILGYEKNEFLSLGYQDVTALHEHTRMRDFFKPLLSGEGQPLFIEKENLRKDGTLVPVRVGISTVRDEEGEPEYLVAVMEDISDRRRAELELANYRETLERRVEDRTRELAKALERTREAREQVDLILKSVGEGLIVTDLDNRVLLMNAPAEEMLGLNAEASLGRRLELAIQGSSFHEKLCKHIQKAKLSADYQFDFEITNAEGEQRIIRARTSVVLDGRGDQTGVVTIMSDVTREREIDRMKTEFISTAAHELRTPLTTIMGFAEIVALRDELPPEKVRRYASTINDSAVRLSNIVSDLLDISRIESGKGFAFNKSAVGINELIQRKVEEFEERYPAFTFSVSLSDSEIRTWLDEGRTEQVLENLLSNAVKYSPEGTHIKLLSSCGGGQCTVEVRDQGLGMNPAQLVRVFDKFYRAHAAGGSIPGTGLGMSIVKHIVEKQGGEIWLESEEGAGTSVFFTVPTLREQQTSPAVMDGRPGSASTHTDGGVR